MMKRAMITLILIVAMLFSVSIATAASFSGTGNLNSANNWYTSGDWQNFDGAYTLTDTQGSAYYPVSASGPFTYTVSFRIGEADNIVNIGVGTAGKDYVLQYSGGKFYFDGNFMADQDWGDQNTLFTATISSADGSVWTANVAGVDMSVNVNKAPTKFFLDITNADLAEEAVRPMIATVTIDYAPGSGPVSDGSFSEQQVRDFYKNVYPLLSISPDDQVKINPDGTFTVTRAGSAAAPATFTVSGVVKSAANSVPVSGATVTLGDQLQKTDSAGKYKFDGVAKGSYDVGVSATGFTSMSKSLGVTEDKSLDFALVAAGTGTAGTVSAANETANATVTPKPANATAVPSATQTKSPGFEGIFAVLAVVSVAGVLIYLNRKH